MSDPRNESPQERVDYYVGLQVEQRRECGDDANAEEIRRGTARLLEMADAETRRAVPLTKDNDGKTGAEAEAAKEYSSPEATAKRLGGEFFVRDVREEKIEPKRKKFTSKQAKRAIGTVKGFLLRSGLPAGFQFSRSIFEAMVRGALVLRGIDLEKHLRMWLRIAQLQERIPNYRLKPGDDVYSPFVYRNFVQLLERAVSNANVGGELGIGGYSEMSQQDRHNALYARLEAICTASDPLFPRGWFIPR